MLWFIVLSDLGRGARGEGKATLSEMEESLFNGSEQSEMYRIAKWLRTCIFIFFFHKANNNGSALGCFAVVRAKCGQSRDVKRASRCLVSWVLLIITAPLEPRRELTFDLNKSGRTDAVRLARLLLCWLKRMKACLDTAASDQQLLIRDLTQARTYCICNVSCLLFVFWHLFEFNPQRCSKICHWQKAKDWQKYVHIYIFYNKKNRKSVRFQLTPALQGLFFAFSTHFRGRHTITIMTFLRAESTEITWLIYTVRFCPGITQITLVKFGLSLLNSMDRNS